MPSLQANDSLLNRSNGSSFFPSNSWPSLEVPSSFSIESLLISSMTAFIFYDEIFKCQEEPNYRQTKYLKLCSGFKSKSFRENKPLIMIIVFKECNEKDL